MEEKTQYELRSREAVAALNTNLAPPFRTGTASFATSAAVANKVANPEEAPDAADVMTGENPKKKTKGTPKADAEVGAKAAKVRIKKPKAEVPVVSLVGVSQQGGSSGSTDVPKVGAGFAVPPKAVQTLAKVPSKAEPEVPPKRRSRTSTRKT